MIKIEQSQESSSYWRQDNLYDKKSKSTRRVKLFGLTLWETSHSFDCDLLEDKETQSKVGFKR